MYDADTPADPIRRADTRLHTAVRADDLESVLALIADGVDVNAHDSNLQDTPLHAAAGAWDEDGRILAALLEAGADIHARNCHGETALHVAALGQHLPMCEALLNAGADLGALNNWGQGVADVAGPEVVAFLLHVRFEKRFPESAPAKAPATRGRF